MRVGTCKHFNGAHHNKTCLAGVCYEDVTTEPERNAGKALRIPCHAVAIFKEPNQLEEFAKRGKCEKYEEPTAAEIAAYEAETAAHVAKVKLTFPLMSKVKKEHKGEDWQGVEVCPVCGGKLHMTHAAYNGNTWGKCETEDCVAWME